MQKRITKNRSPWILWVILLVAVVLAFLIWRYFDIRIEKLKSGEILPEKLSLESAYQFTANMPLS